MSTYSVVLKSNLPKREFDFLSVLAHRITSTTQGEDLLEFRCSKIDVLHHSYIQIETIPKGKYQSQPLMIPHHYVLLIHGNEQRPSVGF